MASSYFRKKLAKSASYKPGPFERKTYIAPHQEVKDIKEMGHSDYKVTVGDKGNEAIEPKKAPKKYQDKAFTGKPSKLANSENKLISTPNMLRDKLYHQGPMTQEEADKHMGHDAKNHINKLIERGDVRFSDGKFHVTSQVKLDQPPEHTMKKSEKYFKSKIECLAKAKKIKIYNYQSPPKHPKVWEHHLTEAHNDIKDAISKISNKEWLSSASDISKQWANETSKATPEQIADKNYNYHYYRAHMQDDNGFGGSKPLDPSARASWEKISGKPIHPKNLIKSELDKSQVKSPSKYLSRDFIRNTLKDNNISYAQGGKKQTEYHQAEMENLLTQKDAEHADKWADEQWDNWIEQQVEAHKQKLGKAVKWTDSTSKDVKGVFPDEGAFDQGKSNVGVKLQAYNDPETSKYKKRGVMRWAKGQHNKLLAELKSMPKPNLPKDELDKAGVNPELMNDEPTHTHNGVPVKVFKGTKGYHPQTKEPSYSAEIMDGEHKGKWTTVNEKDLKPYLRVSKSEYFKVRFEELVKSKNVREQRKKVWGTNPMPSANSPLRDKMMQHIARYAEQRYGIPVVRAPGKPNASGKIIDKPELSDQQIQHIGNPASLLHELAHIETMKQSGMPAKQFQDWMDKRWGAINRELGYKQQAREAEEYESHGAENKLRRQLGLPAHERQTKEAGQKRLFAADRPDKQIAQDVPHKGKTKRITGLSSNLDARKPMFDRRQAGIETFVPNEGWMESTDPNAIINRRASGDVEGARKIARQKYFQNKHAKVKAIKNSHPDDDVV